MPCAFEPVQNISTSGVIDLVKGVGISFLDGHGIALPVATNIRVIRVETEYPGGEVEDEEQGQHDPL